MAIAITVAPGMEAAFGPARDAAQQAAKAVAEGRKVMVSVTSGREGIAAPGHGKPQARPGPPPREAVPGVRSILAVGSGKGGVGKSTVAVNLALGLPPKGCGSASSTPDLYGPSIRRLLGLEGKTAVRNDGIFEPHEAYGLKVMSIGPMLTPDQAVVWRGPMATSALRQLLRESHWGELDVLVVDLPPGTGDIQLTLAQQVPRAGAVIVSTPQDRAHRRQEGDRHVPAHPYPALRPRREHELFRRPDTGARYDIFGHGGARRGRADGPALPRRDPAGDEYPRDLRRRPPRRRHQPRWLRGDGVPRAGAAHPRRSSGPPPLMRRIRPATPADVPALVALDTYAAHDSGRSAEIAGWVAAGECYVLCEGDTPIAYAVLTHGFFHAPFLELLMVAETARRTGAARALVEHCIGRIPAAASSGPHQRLEPAMQALLDGMGFVRSGVIENLDPGDPELIFVRFVPAHS